MPVPALPKPTETDIQDMIEEWLLLYHWVVLPFARRGTHAQLRGVLPTGLPDILAIKDGQYRWLEVKRPGGNLSADQVAAHMMLRSVGAKVDTVYCLEDVIEKLGT